MGRRAKEELEAMDYVQPIEEQKEKQVVNCLRNERVSVRKLPKKTGLLNLVNKR